MDLFIYSKFRFEPRSLAQSMADPQQVKSEEKTSPEEVAAVAVDAVTAESEMKDVLSNAQVLQTMLPYCNDKPGLRTVNKFWSEAFNSSEHFWGHINGRSRRTNDTTVSQLVLSKGALISYCDLGNCKQIGDNASI